MKKLFLLAITAVTIFSSCHAMRVHRGRSVVAMSMASHSATTCLQRYDAPRRWCSSKSNAGSFMKNYMGTYRSGFSNAQDELDSLWKLERLVSRLICSCYDSSDLADHEDFNRLNQAYEAIRKETLAHLERNGVLEKKKTP